MLRSMRTSRRPRLRPKHYRAASPRPLFHLTRPFALRISTVSQPSENPLTEPTSIPIAIPTVNSIRGLLKSASRGYMIRLILAMFFVVLFSANAEARQRKSNGLHPECNVTMPCVLPYSSTPDQVRVARGRYVARQMGFGSAIERPVRKARVAKADYRQVIKTKPAVRKIEPVRTASEPRQRAAATVVSHPPGCPSRAFCGCGAAVRIFGSPVRSLWLAANWLRFPKTAPAPGMVAARRGHVFVLEADLGGGKWLAYDANSGGRKTRIHARSIAGYVIVDPRGYG